MRKGPYRSGDEPELVPVLLALVTGGVLAYVIITIYSLFT